MNMKIKLGAGVIALMCAGAAMAQSHSVANSTNPPDGKAQSQAAVDATPSQSATVHKNSSAQGDKNAGQAGKGKTVKAKKKTTANGAKTSAGSGAESAMEAQPSQKTGSAVEQHAFDASPAKK
jgi:hypothetical protein